MSGPRCLFLGALLSLVGCSGERKHKEGDAAFGHPATKTPKETETIKARSAKNLHEIAAALHGHHDHTKYFPPYKHVHADKRVVELSWRVTILPQMGRGDLYAKFNLNEPWDSPHNKALLPQMPEVYALFPEDIAKGVTRYRVFVGPSLVFNTNPLQRMKLSQISDGMANTILVAEGADAVPWTKPEELFVGVDKGAPAGPLPRLGGPFKNGFHVVDATANVHFIRQDFDEKLMRWAIGPMDGGSFGWSALEAK